jgi:ATP adenylyltransferase
MPILASTMVMPELIPVTYAKLRAELAVEVTVGDRVADLLIVDNRGRALVDGAGRLPEIAPRDDEPIWRAAIREALVRGATDAELLGWAGERHVGPRRPALLLRAAFPGDTALAQGNRLTPVEDLLDGNDAALVRTALEHSEQFDP